MNRHSRLNRIFSATAIVAPCVAIIVGVGASTQPAHADWRSLSGGFLPAFTSGVDFQISPDSRTVAFIADKDTDDAKELYAVPITGTAPIKLNPTLVANGDVENFQFTLDSQFVIYRADQEVDQRVELYRAPVTGGPSVKFSAPLVAGGNVLGYQLDPDWQRIVYLADQEINEVFELWSIPISGGASVKLNGSLAPGGDVSIYAIDSIANRVVYIADQLLDGRNEIFSIPIGGGVSVRLNPELANNRDVFSFQINPIVPYVVFPAQESGATTENLWSMPTAGGIPPNKLNFNLPANDRIIGYGISPFGDKVVFNVATSNNVGNQGYSFVGNLYSTLIGGGVGSVNLTETANPYFGVDYFRFTPNGSHVVYQYQKNATSQKRLESSTVQSGVRATLYEPSSTDPPLYSYTISGDSAWVAHTAGSNYESQRLNTVPIGGGSPTPFGPGMNPLVTPDHGRVIYTRITGTSNHTDLFSAQIFGGDERNLSGMSGAGYVGDTKVSKDGKWIVYTVQIDSRYDLRVSDGNTAQAPTTPTPVPSPTPEPTPTPITHYARLPITIKQP